MSFRTGNFGEKISVVNSETVAHFLEVEFSMKRLDDIDSSLWRVAFPRPPRSLSTQVQLGRTIIATNALDMHLVWDEGKIYLKPLPRYLLEPHFWTTLLAPGSSQPPGLTKVRESALGLLYTYACLIVHPIDLKLALEYELIPKDAGRRPDWGSWRALATEILQPTISHQIHRRFQRGELRLNRLNWIYLIRNMPAFRIYFNPWQNYTAFVTSHMSYIAAATIYIVVVLTAMQVGLTTEVLQDQPQFQAACFGFTIFAIIGPVVATGLVMMVLLAALIPNWISAKSANTQDLITASTTNATY